MKKIAEPPMIILMDILVMFVFIFMLQEKPKIEIVLPEHIYKGAVVAYKSSSGYKVYKQGRWVELDNGFIKDGLFLTLSCDDNLCSEYQTPNYQKKILIIANSLYEQISKYYLLSALNSKYSGSIKIYINSNGNVDKEKTFKNNKNLQKIFLQSKNSQN
jgi:hypothetical protein